MQTQSQINEEQTPELEKLLLSMTKEEFEQVAAHYADQLQSLQPEPEETPIAQAEVNVEDKLKSVEL